MLGSLTPMGNLNNSVIHQASGEVGSHEDDEKDEIAPDGGWGWLVVFASFMIHVLIDGLAYTFGVYTTDLVDHYEITRQSVGWMNSALVGLTFIYGPLASKMCKWCGYRYTTIIGSTITSIGLSAVFFYSAFPFFVIMASGVCGLGCGLCYLPTICIVTEYFKRKRALALGLAVCGSGIGTFAFAPLLNYLISVYSWRGAMLIEGGIILNGAVCGALFLPLPRPSENPSKPPRQPSFIATPVPESTFCQMVSRVFNHVFSFYLLKNASFNLFVFSNFLTSLGFNAPFLFVTDRALLMGVPERYASLLVAVIGAGNTVGRVAFGALAMVRQMKLRLHLYNGSLVACGFITAISCWALEYPLMLAYSAGFGFFSGSYVTLYSVLLVDLLGKECLQDAFGLSLLIMGGAVIAGPPLAGWLFDITKSYDISFAVCGLVILFSGIIMYPLTCGTWKRPQRPTYLG